MAVTSAMAVKIPNFPGVEKNKVISKPEPFMVPIDVYNMHKNTLKDNLQNWKSGTDKNDLQKELIQKHVNILAKTADEGKNPPFASYEFVLNISKQDMRKCMNLKLNLQHCYRFTAFGNDYKLSLKHRKSNETSPSMELIISKERGHSHPIKFDITFNEDESTRIKNCDINANQQVKHGTWKKGEKLQISLEAKKYRYPTLEDKMLTKVFLKQLSLENEKEQEILVKQSEILNALKTSTVRSDLMLKGKDDSVFTIHRAILDAHTKTAVGPEKTLSFNECDKPTLQFLVDYLYSGKAPKNLPDDVSKLGLAFATKKLELKNLRERYFADSFANVKVENFVESLKIAFLLKDDHGRDALAKFYDKNREKIVETEDCKNTDWRLLEYLWKRGKKRTAEQMLQGHLLQNY